MKLSRWIAALAAIALWCVPVKAQDFVQSYNFVNTGTNGPTTSFANTGVISFFISWSPQVSLSACSIQVDSSSDGASWGSGDLIASTSCTTAGSSATATLGAGKNFVRIHVTALTGNGGLNVTMKGWGGGGGGITQVSSLPGTCTAISSPVQLTVAPFGIYTPSFTGGTCSYIIASQSGGAILPASFGVQANWQIESTGSNFTVTSGSPTVTCTTCAFTSADSGKEMFFTNWGGSDSGYSTASAGPLTATTITFVNATTVTLSQNANINAGTTNANAGTLAWGSNDDPASNSPWTALENAVANGINCNNAQISGITNWEGPHFLSASCRGISGGSTGSKYPGITGFGVGAGATILLPPWFRSTGCTGGTSAAACTGQGEWANVSFNTLGQAGNVTISKNFFETFNDGSYKDLAFWGGWGANPGFSFFQVNGGYHIIEDVTIDGGPTPITVAGNAHIVQNIFAGNGRSNTASLLVNTGATMGDYGGAYNVGASGVMVDASASTYYGYNVIQANVSGAASACFKTATGYMYIIGAQCQNAGNTGSVAIQVTGAGYAYATGSLLGGGATGKAWSCAATSSCIAGPGNTYSANPIGNIGCAISSASPAACAKNSSGLVAVPISQTTYTVNTTAVTPNSVIIIQQDTSATAGTALGVTCNATADVPLLTAKVVGTSFTFSLTSVGVNPMCYAYTIFN